MRSTLGTQERWWSQRRSQSTPPAQPAPSSPTARGEQLLFHFRGPWEADPKTHGDRERWVHPQPQAGHRQGGLGGAFQRGSQGVGSWLCRDQTQAPLTAKCTPCRPSAECRGGPPGQAGVGAHSRTHAGEGDTTRSVSTGVRTGPRKRGLSTVGPALTPSNSCAALREGLPN